MIITEQYNETHVKHYSNKGVMIKQVETGNIYADAVDVEPCKFTYEETDIKIIIED